MIGIHKKIKTLLEERERSISWLAQKIDYSRQGLTTSLEKETISLATLINIAKALNISISELMGTLLNSTFINSDIEKDRLIETLKYKIDYSDTMISFYKRDIKDKEQLLANCHNTASLRKEIFNNLLTYILDKEGIDRKDLKDTIGEHMPLIKKPSEHLLSYLSSLNYIVNKKGFK